jgi:glycosyltransferase involved in cell wall biosynthesis
MKSPVRITNQTWPDSTTPVVSVFNWVYNHKDFIRESIESILMQETTFPVEIIIQDDASNDGAREIIEEYQNKYPYLFNNILFSDNQYSQGKSIMNGLFEKPRGKYIALTHGDDYWTDPLKLQKQVDFLEGNEEYVCVGGKVRVKDTRNEINKLQYGSQYFEYNESQEVPKEDILDKVKLPFHTSTYLFKRDSLDLNLFEFLFKHSISGDIPILNMLNAKGKIFFINEELGVQHHNSGGITTTIGHKGLNYLWNRVYMWEQISKLYNQKDLWKLANDNKKYFKEIFTKKFLNVNITDQISFYRNTTILHKDLVKVILVTLYQKVLLKLRLKR